MALKELRLASDKKGQFIDCALDFRGWPIMDIRTANLCDDDKFETFHDMEARPEDVLVLGYPRSGNQWTWDIVNMIVRDDPHPITDRRFLDWIVYFLNKDTDPKWSTHPRVMFGHLPPSHLPEDFIKKRSKIVYITRNPKDIAVSWYLCIKSISFAKYEGEFHDFLDLFYEGAVYHGSWFKYVVEWEEYLDKHPDVPVLKITYEQLQKNLVKNIRSMSEFLGYPRDEDFYESVAAAADINVCRKAKQNREDDTDKKLFGDTKDDNLLRKGTIGGWKQWLTVADNERFDEIMQDKLGNTIIEFDYGT